MPEGSVTSTSTAEAVVSYTSPTTSTIVVSTSAASTVPAQYPVEPGSHVIAIDVGGVEREYTLLIPESIDQSSPAPLVIGFHGWGGNAESIIGSVQQWGAAAEEHGFLLVAPHGLPGTFFGSEGSEWAVLRSEDELEAFRARSDYGPEFVYEYFYDELAEFSKGDRDVEFTAAILEQTSSFLPVDTDRIFVTGFSLGGWMASRVACDLGDRIADLAPTFHSLLISLPCTSQAPFRSPLSVIPGATNSLQLKPWPTGHNTTVAIRDPPVALRRTASADSATRTVDPRSSSSSSTQKQRRFRDKRPKQPGPSSNPFHRQTLMCRAVGL